MNDENENETQEPVDDHGALPADAVTANADVVETDQAVVDRLAGRPGYVIPRTLPGATMSLYHVNDDGVIWDHMGRNDLVREQVANRPFLVKQRLRDDRGEYRYTLTWLSDEGELREITLPAAVITSSRKLHAELPEAIFDDTHASACVKYISRCLAENRQWLVEFGETVVTGLGWPLEGTDYFVSGPGRPTPVEDVKNTGAWLKGHRQRGSIEDTVTFIRETADRPQLQVMVNAALASPVLRVVGADNFVVDLCGETSTGKTRALMLAASLWGEPTTKGIIAMWNMTRTAVEEHFSVLRGVPMFLDDTQLANSPEDVASVVYGVTQGKSRGRSSRDGTLQNVTNFETALLTTGEQPATKLAEKYPGTMPRIMEVTGSPCRDKEQADKLTGVAKANFGFVGPAFVEYLLQQDEVGLTIRLGDLKRELAEQAQSRLAGRRADSVAVLRLTNELAHEAGLVPKMTLDTWVWLMNGGDAITAEDEDVPRKTLRKLLEWAWSNKTSFYGGSDDPFTPSRETPGRWAVVDGYVAVASSLATKILKEKLDCDAPDMVLGVWKERGWLACQGKGRTWRVPVGGGLSVPMYKITMLEDLVDPASGAVVEGVTEEEMNVRASYARHLASSG